MNPEIKAAIEKEAEKFAKGAKDYAMKSHRYTHFIPGAEYGYKLAEEKLDIAVRVLKEVQSHLDVVTYNEPMRLAHVKISEALKELGE